MINSSFPQSLSSPPPPPRGVISVVSPQQSTPFPAKMFKDQHFDAAVVIFLFHNTDHKLMGESVISKFVFEKMFYC